MLQQIYLKLFHPFCLFRQVMHFVKEFSHSWIRSEGRKEMERMLNLWEQSSKVSMNFSKSYNTVYDFVLKDQKVKYFLIFENKVIEIITAASSQKWGYVIEKKNHCSVYLHRLAGYQSTWHTVNSTQFVCMCDELTFPILASCDKLTFTLSHVVTASVIKLIYLKPNK